MKKESNEPRIVFIKNSLSESFVSNSVQRRNSSRISFQSVATGTIEGTYTVEASLDDVNWFPIEDSEIVVSAPEVTIYSIPFPTEMYYRLKFTRTAGTFDVNVLAFVSGAQ